MTCFSRSVTFFSDRPIVRFSKSARSKKSVTTSTDLRAHDTRVLAAHATRGQRYNVEVTPSLWRLQVRLVTRTSQCQHLAMAESSSATKVQLHLYDLSQGMARVMSAQLLGKHIEGVWHTGIVAFGEEWYFGGGIQRGAPGFTHFGPPLQVLELGETHLPREVFEEFLQDIAPRFTMRTYNLLKHNCNNFSDQVAEFLLGVGIPEHIVNLPDEVLSTPFGQQLMPMLSMMDAQMRTASESGGGGGGFGGGFGSAQPPPTRRAVSVEQAVPTTQPAPAPAKPSAPIVSAASSREAVAVAAETRAADAKHALETAIKTEFAKLVQQGMAPNEAAAAAVKAVRERAAK